MHCVWMDQKLLTTSQKMAIQKRFIFNLKVEDGVLVLTASIKRSKNVTKGRKLDKEAQIHILQQFNFGMAFCQSMSKTTSKTGQEYY